MIRNSIRTCALATHRRRREIGQTISYYHASRGVTRRAIACKKRQFVEIAAQDRPRQKASRKKLGPSRGRSRRTAAGFRDGRNGDRHSTGHKLSCDDMLKQETPLEQQVAFPFQCARNPSTRSLRSLAQDTAKKQRRVAKIATPSGARNRT